MTTGHVFIAMSLDGFIAREDNDISWLMSSSAEGEDHGYERFIASIDGVVMGRGTFEKVLTFDEWPYKKPFVVLSRSLSQSSVPAALAGQVQVMAETPEQVFARTFRQGWKRAYIDGGQVIQSFLRAGLIDDLVVTCIPVLIGSGRPLFGRLPRDVRLDHLGTTAFRSGFVQSTYRVRTDD
jgi:dihydrofolate reductase